MIIGLIYAVVYYFVFYFMITKFNFKTPGREADDEETKLFTRKDLNERKASQKSVGSGVSDLVSALIIKGLGGKANLVDLDCCATRLRITVSDATIVNDTLLKQSGASGVIHKGQGVQVIYGPHVSVIKSNLEDFLDSPESDDLDSLALDDGNAPQKEAKPESAKTDVFELFAHMNGNVVALENVEDEAFSSEVLGKGIAIEPAEGKLYSPCDGKIEMVFDTNHAVNIVSQNGCEILLHIGIDTVKLGGKYFEAHVKDGAEVKTGDLLISFDLDGIKSEGYKVTTPMVICNTDDYASIEVTAHDEIKKGDKILEIK